MKKIIAVSLFALLLGFSFNAYSAEDGWYISGNIGAASVNDSDIDYSTQGLPAGSSDTGELEFDKGFLLGVAAGHDFGGFRLEGELEYQKNDTDKYSERIIIPGLPDSSISGSASDDVTSTSFLVNLYYDIMRCCEFRPFIMAGIGMSKIDVDTLGVSDDDTVFAYRVGAGVSYDISEKITVDVGYRYFATPDLDYDSSEAEYSGHSLLFGARYYF